VILKNLIQQVGRILSLQLLEQENSEKDMFEEITARIKMFSKIEIDHDITIKQEVNIGENRYGGCLQRD
jgi:hypothetical protein